MIDQFLNYLLVEKGLSQATLESYSADLLRYADFMQQTGQDTVSAEDTALILKHLINLRNEGLGARSRARHLVSLPASTASWPTRRSCGWTRQSSSTSPRPR